MSYPTKQAAQELTEQILQLLEWTDEQLSMFIFETGLDYLKAYFGDDQQAIDIVKKRKQFWNWFKNHWLARDQSFVETFDCGDAPMSLKLMRQIPSARQLPDVVHGINECKLY